MAWEANAIVEVKIGYVINAQQCFNVLHYTPSGNSAGFFPIDLCTGLLNYILGQADGGLYKEIRDWASLDATFNHVSCQAIYPTRYRIVAQNPNDPGLNAGGCNAQNLQASIEKFGEQANRHSVGAVHLGAMPDAYLDGGFLTVAAKNQLALVANAVKSSLNPTLPIALAYNPVILNKVPITIDGKEKFIISGSTPIFDVQPKDDVRCMTRRTVGRGI